MKAVRTVCIGDFLNKSYNWVEPEPDQTYKQITARLWGKGLTLRAEVAGSQIAAARQLQVKAGQFLVSRIDARHGAFGIVPPNLGGALVSNDFPCFDIDSKVVLPTYFAWYARTESFIALCRRASEGSTNRVRLKENEFLRMTVPLPPHDEQQRIVAKLDKVAALVEERRKVIETAEHDARAMLSNAFREIIDGAPYRPMAEVAPLVRRPVEIDLDEPYTEIGIKSFYNGIFHRRTMSGAEYSWQKLFWIQEGDIVFSNLMAWEKAIAVASADDTDCVGNHRMLTCEVNRTLATPTFLLAYFRTEEGFMQVTGRSPGSIARNKTLSSKKLPTIKVPVPPIDQQRWFDRLQRQVHQVEALRKSAGGDVGALLPAMLDGVFSSETGALAGIKDSNG